MAQARPVLLDLFCGAGGAAAGYHQAGFDIIGVDFKPQPNYPFPMIQSHVFHLENFSGFQAIHASPPCQEYSSLNYANRMGYPDLVGATRAFLERVGIPWVIENVPGAPLIKPVTLCGSMFNLRTHDGFELRRHRLFEFGQDPPSQPECDHRGTALGVYGTLSHQNVKSNQGIRAGIVEAITLMEIDWMHPRELTQAIPPAYARWIGEHLLKAL